jgi:hypothetical protein
MAATVNEVVVGTNCVLVGLTVSGTPAADESGGTAPRWQVFAVKEGHIADICGFDDRDQAGRSSRRQQLDRQIVPGHSSGLASR